MKKLLVLMVIALGGCASNKAVIHEIGDGLYMSGSVGSTLSSMTEEKANLYKEASAFCTAKGLSVVPVTSTGREKAPYVKPSAEITFRCEKTTQK